MGHYVAAAAMSLIEAIVLGVVQGLAEFLPISSSGHLQIAKEILGVQMADNMTFDMTLHVATVLATVAVLWSEVRGLFAAPAAARQQAGVGSTDRSGVSVGRRWVVALDWAMIGKLALSAVPVAVVGLCFRDRLNAILASPAVLPVVGAMMILTAGLLWWAGRMGRDPSPRCAHFGMTGGRARSGISFRDAFIIGVGQAAAVLPGLSRSGTTIATGLLLGNDKAKAARFSFLMIIAPILGNVALDAMSGRLGSSGGIDIGPMAAGFVAAFITGCAACRAMIEVVKRSKLGWFAGYCAVVGTATVLYYVFA